MLEEKKEKKPFFASSTCFNINICNAWKLALDLNKFFQTKRQDNLHFILYWKASKQQLTTTDIFLVYTFFYSPGWTMTHGMGMVRRHHFTLFGCAFSSANNWIWHQLMAILVTHFNIFSSNGQRPSCVPFCDLRLKSNVEKKKEEKQSWMIELCVLVGCLGEKSYASLFLFQNLTFFFMTNNIAHSKSKASTNTQQTRITSTAWWSSAMIIEYHTGVYTGGLRAYTSVAFRLSVFVWCIL